MFAEATRKKFRFPVPDNCDQFTRRERDCVGMAMTITPTELTAEDLWLLSLEQLNDVFKKLVSMCKTAPDESLLGDHTDITEELHTKLRIVRYIFDFKMAEVGTADIREVEANV